MGIRIGSDCHDRCDCDHCRRGKRGRTGPTGPTGPTGSGGSTGSTGSTGPTGSSSTSIAAAVITVAGAAATITNQTGEFTSSTRSGTGDYLIDMAAIPGLTAADQLAPVATAVTDGDIVSISTSFGAGHGILTVHIVDDTGAAADSSFFLQVALIGV